MSSDLFGKQQAARPHLVQGTGGLSGEVKDVREDVEQAFLDLEEGGGFFYTEEYTNLAAADDNGHKTAAASAATEQSFTRDGGDFDGALAGAELVPPRNATITTSAHADIDAVAVEITGRVRDREGKLVEQTDTITLTDGGGTTDAGTKAFAYIDEVTIPAQSGTGGTVAIGTGDIIGLAKPIKTRAGLTAPLREIYDGSVVTNGAFTTPAAQAPHGTYAPNTAPNDTHDYAITYEVEANA